MTKDIGHEACADLCDLSEGDHVRLADTELFAEVKTDLRTHGDEAVFGGGKTLRDGLGMTPDMIRADGALDWVITNATVIDPVPGVVAGDIGVHDGDIIGVGKAGNPDTMDGVDMVVGPATDVYPAKGKIIAIGAPDVHIHWNSVQLHKHRLVSGVTTMLDDSYGGGATIYTTDSQNIERFFQAVEAQPVNVSFYGKGNVSTSEPLVEQVEADTYALRLHEDWGSMPTTIDTYLDMAGDGDVQVCIHTDMLNEAGLVENTFAAVDGRTIHLFHIEGAGDGYVPGTMGLVGEPNMLPSLTSPSMPYTDNTFGGHFDMMMVHHHLNPDAPEGVAFAESRVRAETIAAEGVLHDMGAIPTMITDSRAVGWQAELVSRTWQAVLKIKFQCGPLPKDEGAGADNHHIKCYLTKYTINPAISANIDDYVDTLEPSKLADVVLWDPVFFGVEPAMIFKGDFPVHSEMGEANGSLMTYKPILQRQQAGANGKAKHGLSLSFVFPAAVDNDVGEAYGLDLRVAPVGSTRTPGKEDMLYNDYCPDDVDVDPETFEVEVDGELVACEPTSELPLVQ